MLISDVAILEVNIWLLPIDTEDSMTESTEEVYFLFSEVWADDDRYDKLPPDNTDELSVTLLLFLF